MYYRGSNEVHLSELGSVDDLDQPSMTEKPAANSTLVAALHIIVKYYNHELHEGAWFILLSPEYYP